MKADSSFYHFSIIDSYLESCSVDIRYAYLLIGTIYEASNNSGPNRLAFLPRKTVVQSISLNHPTGTNVSELKQLLEAELIKIYTYPSP